MQSNYGIAWWSKEIYGVSDLIFHFTSKGLSTLALIRQNTPKKGGWLMTHNVICLYLIQRIFKSKCVFSKVV